MGARKAELDTEQTQVDLFVGMGLRKGERGEERVVGGLVAEQVSGWAM